MESPRLVGNWLSHGWWRRRRMYLRHRHSHADGPSLSCPLAAAFGRQTAVASLTHCLGSRPSFDRLLTIDLCSVSVWNWDQSLGQCRDPNTRRFRVRVTVKISGTGSVPSIDKCPPLLPRQQVSSVVLETLYNLLFTSIGF